MLYRRLAVILLLSSAVAAVGQAVPGAPDISGGAQLTVRVSYDNERTSAANLRVELVSAYGSIIDTRMTDTSGTAQFRSQQPGRYKLRISGLTVDRTETGIFEIEPKEPKHTEYAHVKKLVQSPQVPVDQPAISVADSNVPSQARKEFDKGADKLDHKDWEDARDHFLKAVQIYPQYASAYTSLGKAYLNLKDGGEKAVAAFRQALTLDEHQRFANLYMGRFYYENKRFADAEPYLLKAAADEPTNPQIYTVLATTELRNGKLDLALAHARRVHSLPDHAKYAISHLVAADVLTTKGSNQEAADEYRKFLQEDPKSPMAPQVQAALGKLELKK